MTFYHVLIKMGTVTRMWRHQVTSRLPLLQPIKPEWKSRSKKTRLCCPTQQWIVWLFLVNWLEPLPSERKEWVCMLDKNVYERLLIYFSEQLQRRYNRIEIESEPPLYHETIISNRYLVHHVASGFCLSCLNYPLLLGCSRVEEGDLDRAREPFLEYCVCFLLIIWLISQIWAGGKIKTKKTRQ